MGEILIRSEPGRLMQTVLSPAAFQPGQRVSNPDSPTT